MMDTMIGCIATFATSVGGLVATMENGSPWWVSFIISILSPVIYCAMNIALKVIINKEKNKGNLSEKDAEELKHKVDDLTDDGKLNESDKEDHK